MGKKRLHGAAKEAYANKRARQTAAKKQKSTKAQEQTEDPVESPTESRPPVTETTEPIESPVEAESKEIERLLKKLSQLKQPRKSSMPTKKHPQMIEPH